MTIKAGYNDEPLHIKVNGRHKADSELWIEMVMKVGNCVERRESLSYVTLSELVELRDEINAAIRDAVAL